MTYDTAAAAVEVVLAGLASLPAKSCILEN
jgi:hypothetical protein